MSHLRAPDGTVLCEHEDTHDDLEARLESAAAGELLRSYDEEEDGDDYWHGLVDRSILRSRAGISRRDEFSRPSRS